MKGYIKGPKTTRTPCSEKRFFSTIKLNKLVIPNIVPNVIEMLGPTLLIDTSFFGNLKLK
jgi:hypothetical protein